MVFYWPTIGEAEQQGAGGLPFTADWDWDRTTRGEGVGEVARGGTQSTTSTTHWPEPAGRMTTPTNNRWWVACSLPTAHQSCHLLVILSLSTLPPMSFALPPHYCTSCSVICTSTCMSIMPVLPSMTTTHELVGTQVNTNNRACRQKQEFSEENTRFSSSSCIHTMVVEQLASRRRWQVARCWRVLARVNCTPPILSHCIATQLASHSCS